MKEEIEKQADVFVEMFRDLAHAPFGDSELETKYATKIAIIHVEGLISLAKSIKKIVDEEHTNIEIEIEVIRNLLKVKEVLTNRLK